VDKDRPIIILI